MSPLVPVSERSTYEQRKRAFQELGDEATEAERKAAEADWRQAEQNLENIRQQYDLVSRQVRQTTRDFEAASGMASRMENRAGPGSAGVLSALGKAGILNMAGDMAGQWANALVSSAVGGEAGGMFGGTLSGAIQGAAMGSLAGPAGTAVGAAIGGALGLAGGAAQAFQSRDQAFMGYYGGLYETASQTAESILAAGTETAAQRELDAIAFNWLLGDGVGDQYLEDLRTMAASTPMEYADLTTMSRALATGFGDSPERMLELMSAIGDAGSAVGVTAADMTEMARAMSLMNSSGKATLEFLNIFQDRGVDVIGMLGESMGKTQGEIYDMISKGEISGQAAASIIQAGMEATYGGAMDVMSQTFSGLSSTLSDAMTEIDNATGAGYTRMATQGLQADIDAYGGELGEALATANEIIGEGKAIAENLDRQYSREALSALTLGTETTVYGEEQAAALQEMHGQYTDLVERYQTASEEDKAIIAGEIEALKKEAQSMADASYDASSMSQALQDVELDLIAAIRDNTAALGSAAWMRDYEREQELGKGLGGGILSASAVARQDVYRDITESDAYQEAVNAGDWGKVAQMTSRLDGYAYGLDRVPYDGYAALLHEGERVLTAREAREQDQGQKAPIQITITGNSFGAGVSAEEIAQRLADQIELHMEAGVL